MNENYRSLFPRDVARMKSLNLSTLKDDNKKRTKYIRVVAKSENRESGESEITIIHTRYNCFD